MNIRLAAYSSPRAQPRTGQTGYQWLWKDASINTEEIKQTERAVYGLLNKYHGRTVPDRAFAVYELSPRVVVVIRVVGGLTDDRGREGTMYAACAICEHQSLNERTAAWLIAQPIFCDVFEERPRKTEFPVEADGLQSNECDRRLGSELVSCIARASARSMLLVTQSDSGACSIEEVALQSTDGSVKPERPNGNRPKPNPDPPSSSDLLKLVVVVESLALVIGCWMWHLPPAAFPMEPDIIRPLAELMVKQDGTQGESKPSSYSTVLDQLSKKLEKDKSTESAIDFVKKLQEKLREIKENEKLKNPGGENHQERSQPKNGPGS